MKLPPRRSIERKLILFFLVNVFIILLSVFIILLSVLLGRPAINIIHCVIMIFYIPSILFYTEDYIKKSYIKMLLQYFRGDPIENVIPEIKKNNTKNIFGNTIHEEIRIDEIDGVSVIDSDDVTFVVVPAGFYTNIIKNYDSYYIESYRTIIMLKDSDKINKSVDNSYRRITINVTDEKLLAKIKLMEK